MQAKKSCLNIFWGEGAKPFIKFDQLFYTEVVLWLFPIDCIYKMDVPTLISLTGFWCSDFEASMLKVFTAIMFVF